jgi:hypothetical protein
MKRFFSSFLIFVVALAALAALEGLAPAALGDTTPVPNGRFSGVGSVTGTLAWANSSTLSTTTSTSVTLNVNNAGRINWNSGAYAYWLYGGRAQFQPGSYLTVSSGTYFQGYLTNGSSSLQIYGSAQLYVDGTAVVDGLRRFPRYAVYNIPINIHPSYINNSIADFELKISTTNFGEAGSPQTVFFMGTQYGSDRSTYAPVGTYHKVFYTDSRMTQSSDLGQRWIEWQGQQSLYSLRDGGSGAICGAVVIIPVDGVINPLNDGLVASYRLIDPMMDVRYWVPIVPTWRFNPMYKSGTNTYNSTGQ